MEAQKQRRVYRLRSIKEKLDGIGTSTVYRWMAQGKFPKPHPIGGSGHFVVWDAQEVDDWLAAQLPRRAEAA